MLEDQTCTTPYMGQDPYLENDRGWYTVAEKLVKFGTDLHHSFG